jgi:hypothetical protein
MAEGNQPPLKEAQFEDDTQVTIFVDTAYAERAKKFLADLRSEKSKRTQVPTPSDASFTSSTSTEHVPSPPSTREFKAVCNAADVIDLYSFVGSAP